MPHASVTRAIPFLAAIVHLLTIQPCTCRRLEPSKITKMQLFNTSKAELRFSYNVAEEVNGKIKTVKLYCIPFTNKNYNYVKKTKRSGINDSVEIKHS